MCLCLELCLSLQKYDRESEEAMKNKCLAGLGWDLPQSSRMRVSVQLPHSLNRWLTTVLKEKQLYFLCMLIASCKDSFVDRSISVVTFTPSNYRNSSYVVIFVSRVFENVRGTCALFAYKFKLCFTLFFSQFSAFLFSFSPSLLWCSGREV
jgi:hypothetical protein